jgi:S1-C subfamily serine protease
MQGTLIDLSNELAAIVQAAAPHIVSVRARHHYPSSGICWTPNVIVTASHTIQREEDLTVTLVDGTIGNATLAGRDPGTDLAVLKTEMPGSPAKQVDHAPTVKAGELGLVVGRSPDSGVNASLGIISAVSGSWRTWRGGQLDAYIRLDAKLFPQSSGGAVVNARGEIIGMATSALSRIAGIAIPVSTVKRVTGQLLQRGFVPRGYLGIGVQQVHLPEEMRKALSIPNASGLVVLSVEPQGPADKAGVLMGDIVVGIDNTIIEQIDDLHEYSDSGVIGKPVKISCVRGGSLKNAEVIVGERPGRRS